MEGNHVRVTYRAIKYEHTYSLLLTLVIFFRTNILDQKLNQIPTVAFRLAPNQRYLQNLMDSEVEVIPAARARFKQVETVLKA